MHYARGNAAPKGECIYISQSMSAYVIICDTSSSLKSA